MKPDKLQRAAQLWGDGDRAAYYQAGGVMWGQIPAVQRRINEKISGDPTVDWVDHLLQTHLAGRAPVARCLSLCCWQGAVERLLASRGVFQHCTAFDITEPALARARERAAAAGHDNIEYVLQDVNSMVLPEATYDLILARCSLHHITALERVLEQIDRGLKPDGLLVVTEYVGPNRFDYPPRQIELATCALRLLPERYRRSVSWQRLGRVGPGAKRSLADWLRLTWLKLRNGTLAGAISRRMAHRSLRRSGKPYVKQAVQRIVGSEIAVDDPTEAVRSADILPLLREKLRVVEYKPYGGTLLMPVLDDIAGNFQAGDEEAAELLAMLFAIEDALMDAGEIDSDFAFIVAGRREG